MSMSRLKLYNKLDILPSNNIEGSCFLENLESNNDNIELVENYFPESSCLNERSSWFCFTFLVRLLGLPLPNMLTFLTNFSRGNPCYPPGDLIDFSLYCYKFFKSKLQEKKCCDEIFLQAYNLIY